MVTIRRKTTLYFGSSVRMIQDMNAIGLTFRYPCAERLYIDEGHEVNWDAVRALERHGISVEERLAWYMSTCGKTREEIREKYGLSRDTSFDFCGSCATIQTVNYTPETHKMEIQKLYCQLKAAGSEVTYGCESETMDDTC